MRDALEADWSAPGLLPGERRVRLPPSQQFLEGDVVDWFHLDRMTAVVEMKEGAARRDYYEGRRITLNEATAISARSTTTGPRSASGSSTPGP